jgi:hypothetical protein
VCSWARFFPDHSIGPDWAGNIFEVLLAQIGELDADLASDMIVGRRRNADAAGFCDAFKPRRNIYAVAKDVMRLDMVDPSEVPSVRLSCSDAMASGLAEDEMR